MVFDSMRLTRAGKQMQRLVVRPETALVRPFVTAAVLRGVTFDAARFASFIDLQVPPAFHLLGASLGAAGGSALGAFGLCPCDVLSPVCDQGTQNRSHLGPGKDGCQRPASIYLLARHTIKADT